VTRVDGTTPSPRALRQRTSDETESDWETRRAEFGTLLGLPDPVPDAVLRRALSDQQFAHYLLSFTGRPDMLSRFFTAPATLAYAEPEAPRSPAPQGGAELARNAARALARWGRSGFVRVGAETYERRLTACLGCDRLADPPRSLLARITAPGPEDRAAGRACGACGCPVTRKAGLASESCPLPDPADPARTRWGEPRETAGTGLD
jgi:hypothetical protein